MVTIGPGKYTVSEIGGPVLPTFSGNCAVSGNFEEAAVEKEIAELKLTLDLIQ